MSLFWGNLFLSQFPTILFLKGTSLQLLELRFLKWKSRSPGDKIPLKGPTAPDSLRASPSPVPASARDRLSEHSCVLCFLSCVWTLPTPDLGCQLGDCLYLLSPYRFPSAGDLCTRSHVENRQAPCTVLITRLPYAYALLHSEGLYSSRMLKSFLVHLVLLPLGSSSLFQHTFTIRKFLL